MNSILTPSEEAKRKQREQAAISNAIGAKEPGNPVASGNQSQAQGIAAPPAPIMINGIPHQNLPDQKHPGPLGMIADAAAGTIGHIATAAFTNRAEERLAANRAELNNDTAEPIKPTKPAVGSNEAAIRAKNAAVMAGQQSAADPAALAALKTKNVPGSGIAGNLPRVTTQPTGTNAPDGSDISGQKLITNIADGAKVDDSSASALRDQQSNNPYWSPAAQLERMQRRRLETDAFDPSITDPNVRANAQKALGVLGNPADQQLKQAQAQGIAAQAETMIALDSLKKKAATGDAKALATLQAMSGKGAEYKDRYITLPNRKVYNELGQIVGEEPGGIFDAATGRAVQTGQSAKAADAQAKASRIKADMKAGKITRDEAIKQLQSLGFQ